MAKTFEYTTESGVTVQLRRVPQGLVAQFDNNYRLNNPVPQVPHKPMKNAPGRTYPDYDHPNYQTALAIWQSSYNVALGWFVIEAGVTGQPPDDWQPIIASSARTMANYITEQLDRDDEFEALSQAILGIDQVTDDGIDAAKNE